MKKIFKIYFFSMFCVISVTAQTPKYSVDFKPLTFDLFSGDKLDICILEDRESQDKLFDGLTQYYDFKGKFNCYSTDNLYALREVLNAGEFDPGNRNFLKALNDQLSVEYLLEWRKNPDDEEGYQLTIYSTEDYSNLYSSKFYPTVSSNPILDVKRLLVENMTPVYTLPAGRIEINADPENSVFRLFKDGEFFKEWKGKESLEAESGKYVLVTEAEGFLKDEREIEIIPDQLNSFEIKLVPDLSVLPKVLSSDNKITNIDLRLEKGQLKIFYDLITKDEGSSIKLTFSDTRTGSSIDPEHISGDLENVKPGRSRLILWDFGKEKGISGINNYEIKISVEEKSSIAWYLYAGGGAVLAGGLIAILAGGGSDEGTPPQEVQKIGSPPARP